MLLALRVYIGCNKRRDAARHVSTGGVDGQCRLFEIVVICGQKSIFA